MLIIIQEDLLDRQQTNAIPQQDEYELRGTSMN